MSQLPKRTKPWGVSSEGRILTEDDMNAKIDVKNATYFQRILSAENALGLLHRLIDFFVLIVLIWFVLLMLFEYWK